VNIRNPLRRCLWRGWRGGSRARGDGSTYLVGARGAVFVLLDAALPGLRADGWMYFGALGDLRIVGIALAIAA
jgi:hypothetical protein